jgi:hypothetical protein
MKAKVSAKRSSIESRNSPYADDSPRARDAAVEDVAETAEDDHPPRHRERAAHEGDAGKETEEHPREVEDVGRDLQRDERALDGRDEPHQPVAHPVAEQDGGGAAGDVGIHRAMARDEREDGHRENHPGRDDQGNERY